MPASPEEEKPQTLRSLLRHRPIHTDEAQFDVPRVNRTSRHHSQRPNKTATKLKGSSKATSTSPQASKPTLPARKRHGFVYIGIGMLFALLLMIFGQWCLQNIGQWSDTLRYGYPRTFQTDAFVGNEPAGMPSHFIAMNLQGRIEVIVLPGGDLAHAQRYQITHLDGPGANLTPVTIQFVNPQHTKYPDMIVRIQNTQIRLHNINGIFHSP
jgi:hypothetical protein